MKLSNSERYFYQKVLTMKEVDKMLKKCFTVVFASVLISLFATGCTVIREYPPQKENFSVKKAEYELGRDLLQAFVKNDAEKFQFNHLKWSHKEITFLLQTKREY